MNYKKLTSASWLLGSPVVVIFWVSMIVSVPSSPLPEKQNEKRMIPRDCSKEKMDLIKAKPTSEEDAYIRIDCNCNFTSNDIITKRLILEGHNANNVIINGNGATIDGGPNNKYNAGSDIIQVKSKAFLDGKIWRWERPENVTVKNFNIIGSVRVWGMTTNGEGKEYEDYNGRMVNYYKLSSRTAGHVATAKNNAPTGITFNNITITGTGRIPLYISPGVSYSTLINSEIKGYTGSVGIYLDAESTHNTIKRNYIHPDTDSKEWFDTNREMIAVDGSSYNEISCNNFSSLNNGGIYFYRNCGEGGVIRHTTPSHNSILNNIFYYNQYTGNNAAIHLGSRNANPPGWEIGSIGSYCDDENGYPYGSSASNYDYARENVIMGNQICKRYVSQMILTTNPGLNSPNYIDHNETVNCDDIRLSDKITRRAGCYVPNGSTNFISDGKSTYLFKNGEEIRPVQSANATCKDGELILITLQMKNNKLR